ncbi:NAD-dependent deacylase [Planococcus sp. FY231025]|uniref:NAD-dependent deacylase n=1 Tax=Planococcus sp. FY231025 TaxID=3455699 RepID=UPI003F8D93EB
MVSDWLKGAQHAVIFTGAGMSTESGLPDFRSANQGLWGKRDPSKVASVQAMNSNAEAFTAFYRERITKADAFSPHEGHRILADWESGGLVRSIITQNVDGFHQLAGSRAVTELHGSLRKVFCQSCGASYSSSFYKEKNYRCPACGGLLRPAVVLFGEMLPEEPFAMAYEEASRSDLFIVLGSSLSVSPANQFPLIAKEHGARLVIINEEATDFDSYADLVVHGRKIGAVLAEWNEGLN